jgi:hypothetical protein
MDERGYFLVREGNGFTYFAEAVLVYALMDIS